MAEMTAEQLLEAFSEDVRMLALRTRDVVLEEFPNALVKVRGGWKVMTFGPNHKMTELVCVISPQRAWVNLGFARGATLPDSEGMLEGTGKGTRHVKIRKPEQLDDQAFRTLPRAAIAPGPADKF